jgi:hypothetical protein
MVNCVLKGPLNLREKKFNEALENFFMAFGKMTKEKVVQCLE